jgi:hypothetical protein
MEPAVAITMVAMRITITLTVNLETSIKPSTPTKPPPSRGLFYA